MPFAIQSIVSPYPSNTVRYRLQHQNQTLPCITEPYHGGTSRVLTSLNLCNTLLDPTTPLLCATKHYITVTYLSFVPPYHGLATQHSTQPERCHTTLNLSTPLHNNASPAILFTKRCLISRYPYKTILHPTLHCPYRTVRYVTLTLHGNTFLYIAFTQHEYTAYSYYNPIQ